MLQQRVADLLRRVMGLPGVDGGHPLFHGLGAPADVSSTLAGIHDLLSDKLGRDCGEWADQYEPGLGPLDRVRALTDVIDQLDRHFREDPLLGWRQLGTLDPTDPVRLRILSPQVTVRTVQAPA